MPGINYLKLNFETELRKEQRFRIPFVGSITQSNHDKYKFRHELIGVVSRGGPFCGSHPAIYSRISHEAKLWIKSIATSAKESTCS